MGGADFSRREQSRLNVVTQADQFSADFGKSQIEVAFDVFQEHPAGGDLSDDAADGWPEVARVLLASALSSEAERLTGISGSDEMNSAAPWAAVKGCEIVPYRRRSQGLVRHPRHESGRRMGFPLNVTHSSIPWLGDVKAEIKATVAGA